MNPADRVEHVATYDDLPDEGSSILAYFVDDEDTFYEWVQVPDGSSGYYQESG